MCTVCLILKSFHPHCMFVLYFYFIGTSGRQKTCKFASKGDPSISSEPMSRCKLYLAYFSLAIFRGTLTFWNIFFGSIQHRQRSTIIFKNRLKSLHTIFFKTCMSYKNNWEWLLGWCEKKMLVCAFDFHMYCPFNGFYSESLQFLCELFLSDKSCDKVQ